MYVVVGRRAVCCQVYVVVGRRAVLFVAGFGNLPVQGRWCQNLDLTLLCFIAGEAIATSSTCHFVGQQSEA